MRIEKFREALSGIPFDGGLITAESDIEYLTGFDGGGILYLDEKEAVLFVSGVSLNAALDLLDGKLDCRLYSGKFPESEIRLLSAGNKVFFEAGQIGYTYAKILCSLGYKDHRIMESLRVIKEPVEIDMIRTSCRLAAGVLNSVDPEEWRGRTEAELAGYLENQSWKNGASGRAFQPIVAAGKNAAYPHHIPTNNIIQTAALKIDYGLKFKGYCSDLTRTYILTKFIDHFESERLLEALERAKEASVSLLRPGVKCSAIHAAAFDVLSEYGLEKYFTHGVGHGIGLQVHEAPRLAPGVDSLLEESMTLTVEPGLYIRGYGGMRVEDTYLITAEGSELLTS